MKNLYIFRFMKRLTNRMAGTLEKNWNVAQIKLDTTRQPEHVSSRLTPHASRQHTQHNGVIRLSVQTSEVFKTSEVFCPYFKSRFSGYIPGMRPFLFLSLFVTGEAFNQYSIIGGHS
jgi:hypothetical protein